MSELPQPSGVIHDIGYQRYTGPRLGRGYILRSLYAHSLRTAFGFGRTGKAKVFPWLVTGAISLAAVVVSVVRTQVGDDELGDVYVGFPDTMSWLMIFAVAVAAPELVSRDLRSGLPALYFSRPLTSSDYGMAKLAALATTVWALLGAPLLIIFVISGFSLSGGASVVWDDFLRMLGGMGYAVVWAAVFSSVSLLISSTTGKRAFASGGVVAVFLVSTPVVGVLMSLPSATANQLAALFSPTTLIRGTWHWIAGTRAEDTEIDIGGFGWLYVAVTVALVAACVVGLLLRYRRVARR